MKTKHAKYLTIGLFAVAAGAVIVSKVKKDLTDSQKKAAAGVAIASGMGAVICGLWIMGSGNRITN